MLRSTNLSNISTTHMLFIAVDSASLTIFLCRAMRLQRLAFTTNLQATHYCHVERKPQFGVAHIQ